MEEYRSSSQVPLQRGKHFAAKPDIPFECEREFEISRLLTYFETFSLRGTGFSGFDSDTYAVAGRAHKTPTDLCNIETLDISDYVAPPPINHAGTRN